ncbi:hypothetical protein DSCO28_73140 (plasmid) [Desulfosarcina ovata subsp. sediminis]|uniref:Uncharacterized protein n=1 Tax=Desulfosarcina ovata subsp. sediminis TaxID=885957 RepID=A0A5K8A2W2_9BACT|nr:hypothetical protein [Desulfosarcina ovata]BBO86748.1 hypothetical protein DSCO28_73140 [Desulfosarcina ovata subsp. sediminis]
MKKTWEEKKAAIEILKEKRDAYLLIASVVPKKETRNKYLQKAKALSVGTIKLETGAK